MNTDELLKYHAAFCAKAQDIMAKKNHDYAGQSGTTPFANFETTERVGVTTTEKGMLVRILDKIQRLNTFADCGQLKADNESAEDACMDIVNYAILLAAFIKSKGTTVPKNGGKQLVYLGVPYAHLDERHRWDRLDLVNKAVAYLFNHGYFVFLPISYKEAGALGGDRKAWAEYDERMLSCCDLLMVLTIPGWQESAGVKAEMNLAANSGKPVRFLNIANPDDPNGPYTQTTVPAE